MLSEKDHLILLQEKVGSLRAELHSMERHLGRIERKFIGILLLNFLTLAGVCYQIFLYFQ